MPQSYRWSSIQGNSVSHWSILSRYFITNLIENACKCSASYSKVRIYNHATAYHKGCFGNVKPRERVGFRQLKITCSRPYCRRFNACKSGVRDGRFRFFSKRYIQLLFCTWKSAMFCFKQSAKARQKSYKCRDSQCKSAVQKSTLKKKLEHVLPCKSSLPCQN